MLLGLIQEPEEGWPLEDVEAVLFQAVKLKKIMMYHDFHKGAETDSEIKANYEQAIKIWC